MIVSFYNAMGSLIHDASFKYIKYLSDKLSHATHNSAKENNHNNQIMLRPLSQVADLLMIL